MTYHPAPLFPFSVYFNESMPPTRIYLTGFMGSGKSTVGPRLAARLGYAFVDLDDAVAARAGRPVAKVFAEEGEAAFRVLEADALRATAAVERTVVALGGGALASPANLAWAREAGTIVYLRLSPAALAARLTYTAAARPLLHDDGGRPLAGAALTRRIAELLGAREAFYAQAHAVVEVEGQTVQETVEAVRRAVTGG